MQLFFPPFPQTLEIAGAISTLPPPRRRGSISPITSLLWDTHSEGKVSLQVIRVSRHWQSSTFVQDIALYAGSDQVDVVKTSIGMKRTFC